MRGEVVESGAADVAIIDVHGVGYEVHMASRDLAALRPGETVTLVIETVVREDMIRLYGFRHGTARDWFRLLQSVQAVGAKVALGVLSVLSPDELATAIAAGDRVAVARAPGVGKRVAERIVTELKSKVATMAMPPIAATADAPAVGDEALADAVSALVNLGYDEREARATVMRLRAAAPEASAAELIRGGLKALAA
nr:Holliday junction branch migration protein RuvA [Acuticoccus mangrovi]